MPDSTAVHHDAEGPVVVDDGVPLDTVRHALGAGRWISRARQVPGWALFVTTDERHAVTVAAAGVPVVVADDPSTLLESLRALDDGAFVTPREAELLAWINAIRAEEERNQTDRRRHADERVEALQAHITTLTAAIAAIEASGAWRLARRLSSLKGRAERLVRPGRRG